MERSIYSYARRIVNGKKYTGAAIGVFGDLEGTEKAAIRNLLQKIENYKT